MAVTSSQDLGAGQKHFACGSYLESGTAAAFTIECGFQPNYVMVQNQTSGDKVEWYKGMTAAHAVKTTGLSGVIAPITSLGITVDARGFTVGLDLDVNVSAEQLRWIAMA